MKIDFLNKLDRLRLFLFFNRCTPLLLLILQVSVRRLKCNMHNYAFLPYRALLSGVVTVDVMWQTLLYETTYCITEQYIYY